MRQFFAEKVGHEVMSCYNYDLIKSPINRAYFFSHNDIHRLRYSMLSNSKHVQ